MAQINRHPVGLQDLLGAKAFGVNPRAMTETVIPTINQSEFLLADLPIRLSADASAVVAANSDTLNAAVSVPSGEIWAVIAATARNIAVVAGAGDCQLKIEIPSAAISVGLTEVRYTNSISATGIGFVQSHTWTPPGPFFAGPGLTFQCWGQNGGGGTHTYRVEVAYRRLVQ